MSLVYEFRLPYPPSVNHYWKNGRNGGKFLSPAANRFRADVAAVTLPRGVLNLNGQVLLEVKLYPPDDGKTYDIDNVFKALLDGLKHARVYLDDAQVVHLNVWKFDPYKRGHAEVRVWER